MEVLKGIICNNFFYLLMVVLFNKEGKLLVGMLGKVIFDVFGIMDLIGVFIF